MDLVQTMISDIVKNMIKLNIDLINLDQNMTMQNLQVFLQLKN